ncbi:hypothetical protein P3S67_005795 [Capsicum chacoense]
MDLRIFKFSYTELKKKDCGMVSFNLQSPCHLYLLLSICVLLLPLKMTRWKAILERALKKAASAIDPLHHQTSAQFDEGGAKGLLLNNLRIYGDCHVLFDSFEIPGKSVPEATRDDGIISIDICCAKVLWLWNYMLVLGFFPLSAGRFFVCDPLSIDCFGPSLLV